MKRNKFNLSSRKLCTFNMGQLIPIGVTDVLPGDSFRHSTSGLVRLSPLVHPVMHPTHIHIRHFFIPLRLIWKDFADFITGGEDGLNASVPPFVKADEHGFNVSSLMDYLGVPPEVPNLEASALYARALACVYNEYYRDKRLEPELVYSLDSGLDTTTSLVIPQTGWQKDYFTTSCPEPQLGPDVIIPILGQAPVKFGPSSMNNFNGNATEWRDVATEAAPGLGLLGTHANGKTAAASGAGQTKNLYISNAYADLEETSGVSINDLWDSIAQQKFQNARSRYGADIKEYYRYLGVVTSDARLQKPEYLGGSRETIQYSEVLGTSPENLGELGGHGIAATRTNTYQRFFEEHGIIMTLASVVPVTVYADGMPRMFSRKDRNEYWQKEMEHTGQQEVRKSEVYAAAADPNDVFGYQDRYDEYRREESSIAGEFRTTLAAWHQARMFDSEPELNSEFIRANPSDRIFADKNAAQLRCMFSHKKVARRIIAHTGTSYTT